LCLSGLDFAQALRQLSAVKPVPGRMECFSKKDHARIIVDYAHTPDALQKVLASLQQIKKGRLICIFGCGGDRDQGKRPLMGKLAESYADQIVLTNDNPRSEDPEVIIKQILAGIEESTAVSVIPDRASAITSTINSALADDLVLVAGKGHETYQEIAGIRSPFSDRQLIRNLLGITA
jgi:UDP-N-acetylmuramoyl-L-alanyl-D-glutamate--2,6-diaminopimelate ligase